MRGNDGEYSAAVRAEWERAELEEEAFMAAQREAIATLMDAFEVFLMQPEAAALINAILTRHVSSGGLGEAFGRRFEHIASQHPEWFQR